MCIRAREQEATTRETKVESGNVGQCDKMFLLCLAVAAVVSHASAAEMVDMKIVDEPSSFGLSNSYGQSNQAEGESLKLRVQPANFSGPPHFRRLLRRCFHSVINDYKYNFCPFANITQHEQGIHWNPYKGVLGVWQEWEVVNNTFVAMLMKDGDSCGTIYRSVRVSFMCGNHSVIVNVSEPQTCSYQLVFQSPLVCHPDAMLVYPTLSSELQEEWDRLEGEMIRGELTPKGYKRRLEQILQKAGILLTNDKHTELIKQAEELDHAKSDGKQFDSLATCSAEYKKLEERIQNLTDQLEALQQAVIPKDQSTRHELNLTAEEDHNEHFMYR